MMERRFVKGAQVRAKAGDKPGIEGYGAVFNEDYVLYEDGAWKLIERIKPGAFGKPLAEKQDTRCLFNHEADNVLGRTTNKTLRMVQDKEGLHYENDLDMRTTVAQNVAAFVDRGDVTGCSFAFTVSKQVWRDEKSADGKQTISTREIEEIGELYDVGPVTYPAYEGTSVSPRARAEARSLILQIDGLPAEVRSYMQRKKRELTMGEMAQGCQCDCPECEEGECAECTNANCDDPNCEHAEMNSRPVTEEERARLLAHIAAVSS